MQRAAAEPLLSPPFHARSSRRQFVREQQQLARSAMNAGQTAAAREAMRTLRSNDFERVHRAEIHLGVLRDKRSELSDVTDALAALTLLAPRAW
jgi:hypothetical protein